MQNRTQRLRPWLTGAALLALSLAPRTAFAAEPIRTMLDGRELTFPTSPVIENERTLVPARGLLEALGATVGWDAAAKTVSATLGETVVKTVIGETMAEVNGKPVELQVPPRIAGDGHTMIPLRFFVEQLGLAVAWDGETRTIHIDTTRNTTVSRDGASSSRRVDGLVEKARTLVGLPYAWGGTSPETGFDCSGFVYYLGKTIGMELPRTSYEMFDLGGKVEAADLKAGDLVFFTTYAAGPSHVGVYDGKGSFIHAQSEETGVRVTPMSSAWWRARYLGARRVFR